MSTTVYGAGDGSVVWAALNHTTAASFGQCRHFGPALSQLFSAILGVFGGGTAILGVFGGEMAQKRLDTNMRLCGQVVLRLYPLSCSRPHQCTIVRLFLSRFPLQNTILWGQTWKILPLQHAYRHAYRQLYLYRWPVHTSVSGYYNCKFSRSTALYTRVDMAVDLDLDLLNF
jgi:hypothetical protein